MTDTELLELARRRPEALREFYDRYEAAVAAYFMRRTRLGIPRAAADDEALERVEIAASVRPVADVMLADVKFARFCVSRRCGVVTPKLD